MKRYTVAEARARFSDLLDAAEQGDPAVIERRGVRFVLRPEPVSRRRSTRRSSLIEAVDPSVLDGQWTWSWRLATGDAALAAKLGPQKSFEL